MEHITWLNPIYLFNIHVVFKKIFFFFDIDLTFLMRVKEKINLDTKKVKSSHEFTPTDGESSRDTLLSLEIFITHIL